jgi:hypothetical protein
MFRLEKKMWDELSSSDFACTPQVIVPKFVFATSGVNVTLACLVKGSPASKVKKIPIFYRKQQRFFTLYNIVEGATENANKFITTHPPPLRGKTYC